MTGAFLAGIGTRLADRWVNAVLLPGLLWLAVLVAGLHLGQAHAFAVGRLGGWLDRLAARPAAHAPGTVALAACAIALAAAGVGLAAGACGGLVERLWALPGDRRPAAWLLAWRRRRWDLAERQLKAAILAAARGAGGRDDAVLDARVRACRRRRARLGPARPERPLRTGDRFARTTVRIARVNGLNDLALAWPRLWTVLRDQLRTDVSTARDTYAATARLAGWGLLHLALAAVWWPAALVGATVLVTSALRAQAAADVLADLIETACDLHLDDLATGLGLPAALEGAAVGHAVTARLRGAPAAPRSVPPPAGPQTPAPRAGGAPGERAPGDVAGPDTR
ncbi:hypothetical protein SAMN05216267_1002279 [Actinacidiphila rubida]|uniref:Uncharacterized protein n=1 Tax=Actinacidiphila rubida TaxID=310780 RepID=A0A1H8EML0_9ACTN|nr:hypothetical protein [Actinacidiphila rubida]SEN20636.1 hypothetical protein SAMN05216267_1002279 [Actinacidiphila rubida]